MRKDKQGSCFSLVCSSGLQSDRSNLELGLGISLSESMYEAGVGTEQGVFDDGSDPVVVACVWPSSFLLNVVVLSVKFFSLRQATREKRGGTPWNLC